MQKQRFASILASSMILFAAAPFGTQAQAQAMDPMFCTPQGVQPPMGWTPDMGLCYEEFDKMSLYFENGGTMNVTVDSNGWIKGGSLRNPGMADPNFIGLISYAVSRCAMNATCTRYVSKFAEGVAWWAGGNCANSYLQNGRCSARP